MPSSSTSPPPTSPTSRCSTPMQPASRTPKSRASRSPPATSSSSRSAGTTTYQLTTRSLSPSNERRENHEKHPAKYHGEEHERRALLHAGDLEDQAPPPTDGMVGVRPRQHIQD